MSGEPGIERFRLQAFTPGAVGELLDWIAPVLGRTGARVHRWEARFAFARIEVHGPQAAAAVCRALMGVGAMQVSGITVLMPDRERPTDLVRRLEDLALVVA